MNIQIQFRKLKGEIIAVFPYEIQTDTHVLCYAHIGQHSDCVWWINNFTRPASEPEYRYLLNELKGIYEGYEIEVIKRRSHKKFLEAYNKHYVSLP